MRKMWIQFDGAHKPHIPLASHCILKGVLTTWNKEWSQIQKQRSSCYCGAMVHVWKHQQVSVKTGSFPSDFIFVERPNKSRTDWKGNGSVQVCKCFAYLVCSVIGFFLHTRQRFHCTTTAPTYVSDNCLFSQPGFSPMLFLLCLESTASMAM